jgi:TolB protein
MRIAFTSPCRKNQETYPGAGVWIMAIDGSSLDPLPTQPGGDFDPSWGSDGIHLAFTSLRNGRPQIHVINLDTSEIELLSGDFEFESQPEWSPDDSAIAFVSGRSGEPQLYLMPLPPVIDTRLARGGDPDSSPDWSPDGTSILFHRALGGVPRLFAIRYEDRGGVGQQICAEGPSSVQPMAEGSWSPDSMWIALETWPTGANHDIAIITATCTGYAELATDLAADFDPAWRP